MRPLLCSLLLALTLHAQSGSLSGPSAPPVILAQPLDYPAIEGPGQLHDYFTFTFAAAGRPLSDYAVDWEHQVDGVWTDFAGDTSTDQTTFLFAPGQINGVIFFNTGSKALYGGAWRGCAVDRTTGLETMTEPVVAFYPGTPGLVLALEQPAAMTLGPGVNTLRYVVDTGGLTNVNFQWYRGPNFSSPHHPLFDGADFSISTHPSPDPFSPGENIPGLLTTELTFLTPATAPDGWGYEVHAFAGDFLVPDSNGQAHESAFVVVSQPAVPEPNILFYTALAGAILFSPPRRRARAP